MSTAPTPITDLYVAFSSPFECALWGGFAGKADGYAGRQIDR
jgi:hypothetical protein